MELVRQFVRGCKRSGYALATVIVTVKNSGGTWVRLEAGQSDYTIYDAAGSVAATGSFLYAYPNFLAPGQTGYLADEPVFDGVDYKDLKRLDADGRFVEVTQSDAIVLKASGIKLRTGSYGDGPFATGTIQNTSSTDVDQAHAGAVFLDAKGNAIGISTTNLIENLAAGRSKGFQTLSGQCAPSMSAVKKTVVLAGDDNF